MLSHQQWSDLFTILAVGFTAFQWWSASRSADAAERQLKIAEAALMQQIAATQSAFALAKESAAIAELALRVGNRAWFHVFEVKANDQLEAPQIFFRPDVKLKNYGSTPATCFMADCRLELFDRMPTMQELEIKLSQDQGYGVVSPGDISWQSAKRTVTFDELGQMKAGKKLVLYGRAQYNDIFDKTHKSAWLYWYDTEQGGFIVGPLHNYVL